MLRSRDLEELEAWLVERALEHDAPKVLFRLTREPQAPPLQPIRSLRYFVPVIEEVLSLPLPDNYLSYLKLKMRSLAPTQKSNSGQRTPAAPVQESAFSKDR